MIVITCLAILAVDFKVFPRRFAKVETWGTSLMDLGVGSFVFSAGVVGAKQMLKESSATNQNGLISRLLTSARHSAPLLVLGLTRLFSVKGLDYNEHVSEYGVHWNFFFTLAFIPPFVVLFQSAFRLLPSYAALSIGLGVAYQAVLQYTDLRAFILTAPRDNLFSKNREGIFSFFGYLAIFLAGQATGMYLLPRRCSTALADRRSLLFSLMTWSAVWTALFVASSHPVFGFGLTVSRRLANLPYFLWVSAFNCVHLTTFCAIDSWFFLPGLGATDVSSELDNYKRATSRVLEAFNRNGLAIFLVANLLTGLVNLTIPTLDLDRLQSMTVLAVYAAVLTGLAVGLDLYDISVKL
jgi:phosphatidylinositol glycan class W